MLQTEQNDTPASAEPQADTHSITGVIERTQTATGGDKTSLREVLEALGQVSHSGVLLVPAILIVSPLSGIPGASSVAGIIIALVSAQMVFGKKHLWLPRWVLNLKVDSRKFDAAIEKLKRPAHFIDRHTHERLPFLVKRPMRIVIQVVCLLCGAVMPLLEFVPFSSSILGAAVSFFAIALVVRDGLLALFGLAFVAGAGALAVNVLLAASG